MGVGKRIRLLIIDDSAIYREGIAKGVSSDPKIQVVATAVDAFDARDKIIKYQPDVITCDVEMPKMNGIDFIRWLIPQYPLPVIMVSGVTNIVFDAMDSGAVDFVAKPSKTSKKYIKSFIDELIKKIKIASEAKVQPKLRDTREYGIRNSANIDRNKIIAIGASTGGTEAIFNILKNLPRDAPGIAIVQHIPSGFSKMFADRLNATTGLQVKEARTGDEIKTGKALIAPGDKHMRIKKIANKYKVECFEGDKVNGHRPSVDILFESVAREVGRNSIGLILTGMGYDGAKGLLAMKRKGARTIGQDEKTSIVYGMPRVAYDIGAVEKQIPLYNIPQTLYEMLMLR